jgi:hypothetical protein
MAGKSEMTTDADAELTGLREGFFRWEVFYDPLRYLLVAYLRADRAVKITAENHHQLRQKLADREARIDARVFDSAIPAYIRPYVAEARPWNPP